MRVRSIVPAGADDVYNMEVDGTHDFVLFNGIVAHNCYDELRYVCMAHPIAPPAPAKAEIHAYSPLDAETAGTDTRYAFYRGI